MWKTMWKSCGRKGDNFLKKIMKLVIHILSTHYPHSYPHTYPHYYIGLIFFLIISTVFASASSYFKSSAIFSIPWLIVE